MRENSFGTCEALDCICLWQLVFYLDR